MKHVCPLIIITIIIILQHYVIETQVVGSVRLGNETDRMALLAIKNKLVDHPGGVLNSWNHSIHHCSWEGVTCGRKHNRVTVLDLSSRGLGGTISPFIGNLSFLRNIMLYNNSLHGQIPPEINCLYRLQALMLFNNTLGGKFPANLTRNLMDLSVGFNKLEGNLPNSLGELLNLQLLSINRNNFSGPLFNIIANLTSLEILSALNNSFTGTIPESVGKMSNLNVLEVGENQLSGVLPKSIFNLSSLQYIEFVDNRLQGDLPGDIGLTLPGLKHLNLARNNFSGLFPASITNITSLEVLALGKNGFTGRVPHDFGRLRSLWFFDLAGNPLTGDISFISSLVNCTKLQKLQINQNQFTGQLPESIANLSTSLIDLIVADCPISGTIPKGITKLTNLVKLLMSGSQLTGSLPSNVGELHKLEVAYFYSNRLTGKIPNSFGNLSLLSKLRLDDNSLEGSIPQNLGNCRYLEYMGLSMNKFNGTLGKNIFQGSARFIELDLSHNHLEGALPLEITNQIYLTMFDVSENKLSGDIPSSLGTCSGLQLLDLHGNLFHGAIPPSLTSLGGLNFLDLSRNNLSGPIPQYLSKLPLFSLNLSYNNFEGGIPTVGVFANVSGVSLVGNGKLCGGISELHLPKCAYQKERKTRRRMSYALKVAVPLIFALIVITIAVTLVYLTCHKKKKSALLGLVLEETLSGVSYHMLRKSTNGFSSEKLLGMGTFGSVFEGMLKGNRVAVKVLNLRAQGGLKSFVAECKALKNVRHRNLVRVITACSSIDFQGNEFKALVFVFMDNGNLGRWLHVLGCLSLLQRLEIAIDVACAINYLHCESETPIVHCDLKPSNVLLDKDMVAHVADFGLAKFLEQPQHSPRSSSIGVRGTVGYAAPEYGLGSEVSSEGDLYSYGILLLELMTGKRPTDNMFNEGFNLHTYVEAALPDQVLQVVDPRIEYNETTEDVDDRWPVQDTVQRRVDCIVCMVNVGVACSKYLPQDRMRISDAIRKLKAAKEKLLCARHPRNFPRGV